MNDALAAAGYALYAVSYDDAAVLSAFAAKHGVTYPLLSDAGSLFIRKLGILNDEAPAPVAGIPHPGTFVLNADGTVRSKHFYPGYRERDTGAGVLGHLLGLDRGARGQVHESADEGVAIRASLDSDSYAWGQRIWLTVELDIAPGLHVYGKPTPDGYYPLDISVAPVERVTVGDTVYPHALPFRVQGLDDEFFVHEGQLKVSLPLTFMVVDAGALQIRVTVSYQACSGTDCLAPASAEFTLHIAETSLIDRVRPA